MIEPLVGTGAMPSQAGAPLLRPGGVEAPATNAAGSQSPAPSGSFAAALQAAAEAGDARSAANAGVGAEAVQPEAMAGAELEPAVSPEPEPVPSAEPPPPPSAAVEPMPGIETQTTPGQAPYGAAVDPYAVASAVNAYTAAAYRIDRTMPNASSTPGYGAATLGYAAPPGAQTQLAAEAQSGAATRPTVTSGAHPYEALIQQAALRNGVEPALLKGLIEQESGFDPNARSSAGALGLTQLMPSTAASLGVRNPLDPTEAVEGGARLLGELLRQFGGNVSDALAAYNAGAGAVQRYGGVPPYPETEAYVVKVLANARSFRQGG